MNNESSPAAQVQRSNSADWPLLDRVEFALRDAGFDYDEAFRIAHAAAHPAGDALWAVRDGYYLASFKHKANNGEVMWWKGDNAGYSPDLAQAGIYTELVPGYHDSEHTVPVPVAFLAGLRVRRTVDPGDSLNHMFWSAERLRAALQHRGDSQEVGRG